MSKLNLMENLKLDGTVLSPTKMEERISHQVFTPSKVIADRLL